MRKRLRKKLRKRREIRVAQIVSDLCPPKYSVDVAVGPDITVMQVFETLFEAQVVKDIQEIEDVRILKELAHG